MKETKTKTAYPDHDYQDNDMSLELEKLKEEFGLSDEEFINQLNSYIQSKGISRKAIKNFKLPKTLNRTPK